jgi:4'-phosphopantetheinyl transferase
MHATPINRLRPISVEETLKCEAGTVDLWYCFYQDYSPELLTAQQVLLSPDERDRLGSFRFEHDRHLFLATRALLRNVLSSYSTVPPAEWRFIINEHGKPRIGCPTTRPSLHFNLSNTTGLAVCAVSAAHEQVGVDVERTDVRVEALALGKRYFSASEFSILQELPAEEQSLRFFAYWTLKESYVKARGVGLKLCTNQFSFCSEEEIKIVFDENFDDDAALWRFALVAWPSNYLIGLSVRTGGSPLALRVRGLPLPRS